MGYIQALCLCIRAGNIEHPGIYNSLFTAFRGLSIYKVISWRVSKMFGGCWRGRTFLPPVRAIWWYLFVVSTSLESKKGIKNAGEATSRRKGSGEPVCRWDGPPPPRRHSVLAVMPIWQESSTCVSGFLVKSSTLQTCEVRLIPFTYASGFHPRFLGHMNTSTRLKIRVVPCFLLFRTRMPPLGRQVEIS